MAELPNVRYSTKAHRLTLNGKAIPTVTTITGLLDKGGLKQGAANLTAEHTLECQYPNCPTVKFDEHGNPESLYDHRRYHYQREWDAKAQRGTDIHAMALAWAEGKDVDCPVAYEPFIDALERFYNDHQPEWVEMERNVLHLQRGYEYGGQFDYIRRAPDGLVLGDIKSGKRYPDEHTLQVVGGYRPAEHMATYDDAGRLVKLEPMLAVASCEVLYLHDDGTYELLALPDNGDAKGIFLRLRQTWAWRNEMRAWERSHPEPERLVGAS